MTMIPDNGTPVTTDDLLAIIGELLVQNRMLQRLLREKHASTRGPLQNGHDENWQEDSPGIQTQQSSGS